MVDAGQPCHTLHQKSTNFHAQLGQSFQINTSIMGQKTLPGSIFSNFLLSFIIFNYLFVYLFSDLIKYPFLQKIQKNIIKIKNVQIKIYFLILIIFINKLECKLFSLIRF